MAALSDLESKVINVLWDLGPSTVDAIARALPGRRKLKESTVRTILARMEKKGVVTHSTAGRSNVYQASLAAQHMAIRGVRDIIDRLLGGSVEALLVGMVNGDVVGRDELATLAKKVRNDARRARKEKE